MFLTSFDVLANCWMNWELLIFSFDFIWLASGCMSWVELIPANVSSFSLCFVFFVCGLYVWFYFCVCAFGNGLVDACAEFERADVFCF